MPNKGEPSIFLMVHLCFLFGFVIFVDYKSFFRLNYMAIYSNQCPLCSEYNSLETYTLVVEGQKYFGVKCNKCNKTVASTSESEHEKIENMTKEVEKTRELMNNQ